jgi:hypothetical protein
VAHGPTPSHGCPSVVDAIHAHVRPMRLAPLRDLAQIRRREQGVRVAFALQAAPVGPHRQYGGGRLTAT